MPPYVHVLAAFAAMGCLVSFNDYPTGDLRPSGDPSQGKGGAATATAGSTAIAGTGAAAGTLAAGGSLSGSGGTQPGAAGAGDATGDCVQAEEICDGLDNNCDDTADEGDICPSNCSGATFLDQAYIFCTQPADRDEAAAQCAASDMALVRIDSLEENTFLWETMKNLVTGTQVVDMHIGGTDAASEGHWLWPDGTEFWNGDENGMAVDGAFEHWLEGTPNNQSGGWQDENCAVIHLDDATGAWGDSPCYDDLPFACEPQ